MLALAPAGQNLFFSPPQSYSYIDQNTPTDLSLTNSNSNCTGPATGNFLQETMYTGTYKQMTGVLACSDSTGGNPTLAPTPVSPVDIGETLLR